MRSRIGVYTRKNPLKMKLVSQHEIYMRRCFDLAKQGAGYVSPNPLVGSVLVYNDRIIGEGFHREYGKAHAERNAILSVSEKNKEYLPEAQLFVSLEPCCHYGRTPPCTDLILSTGIREVFVSVQDPNPQVSGRGIQLLREHNVTVHTGILEQEGFELIRFFHTYMKKARPYIILKIVQSSDGLIGREDKQVWLSNEYERVMVHKLRSEVDAILVGTNTAVIDNPELTTRSYPGKNPTRVILDRTGRIPVTHHVFDTNSRTLLFTDKQLIHQNHQTELIQCDFGTAFHEQLLSALFQRRIQSMLIEGGAQLISSFLEKGLWDEAIVVRTPHKLKTGIKAPLIEGNLKAKYHLAEDEVLMITP